MRDNKRLNNNSLVHSVFFDWEEFFFRTNNLSITQVHLPECQSTESAPGEERRLSLEGLSESVPNIA